MASKIPLLFLILISYQLGLSLGLLPQDVADRLKTAPSVVTESEVQAPTPGIALEAGVQATGEAEWPMAGANPERTSWTAEEVRGELRPLWYKPFEPYISQKVQIIAAYNTLYIATAGGLYALDAESGAQRWVYPTDLPLGHSPTIQDGVAYVGGFDHKLHAIDAFSGQGLWTFEAGAGFQTNPLVVDGKVYAGNRDGFFYAIHTQGPQAGQLAWKYPTQGPILFSAAYKDGAVYFASQDSHAYALDALSGALVWQSAKLPGAGFHSFWPVVYRDRVIFAGSRNYRSNSQFLSGGKDTNLEADDVYPNRQSDPDGTWVGLLGQEPGDWAPGTRTLDTSRPNVTPNGQTTPITEYFEQKPWRRTYFVLDSQSGQEVTYDFDGDGQPEYAPILWFGTHSGNRYPPVVGGDGVLYQSNNFLSDPFIPWGHISGWKLDTPFISLPAPGRNAIDEPQGYAAGGNLIYWNRCCDRVGAAFDPSQPGTEWTYFGYNLVRLLPGYNLRYHNPDPVDYTHVYASFGGPNGVYGFHADTNPPIPYQGKVYMHRSNAVIAFAPSSSPSTPLPMAETVPATPSELTRLGPEVLKARLAAEIQKMLSAGHLRPGYASHGHFDLPSQHQCGDDLVDYFHHPAETILTLLRALPALPESMQPQVRAYLQTEFRAYPPYEYNHIGWRDGAARETFNLPPEVEAALVDLPPQEGLPGFVWSNNPYSFYALWKYAAFLNDSQQAYQLFEEAQSSRALMDSLIAVPDTTVLARMPMVHNAYIVGYLGYLGLEQLAGQPESGAMRSQLQRLLWLRASQFSKDSAYARAAQREEGAYCRTMNVASNFMFLVPELAGYLRDHALAKVQAAVTEYESLAPYWFVPFAAEGFAENALTPLHDTQALFLAKAWILEESGAELEKYLDVPAFARGDLFYIQKLVAAIENSTFTDVPIDYWARNFIERLYTARITGGCNASPPRYCPEGIVTRDQMAVFLLRGIHGAGYSPPAVGPGTGFGDAPSDYWAATFIKQLAVEGITTGCGSGNYCPENPVTRAQMAIFLLRSKHGASYTPPGVGTATGFGDVPPDHWAAAWIKQLVTEGITAGCGNGNYCPEAAVTRAQMAVFLVKTFNLP